VSRIILPRILGDKWGFSSCPAMRSPMFPERGVNCRAGVEKLGIRPRDILKSHEATRALAMLLLALVRRTEARRVHRIPVFPQIQTGNARLRCYAPGDFRLR